MLDYPRVPEGFLEMFVLLEALDVAFSAGLPKLTWERALPSKAVQVDKWFVVRILLSFNRIEHVNNA